MRELRDSKGRFVAGHKKVGGIPKGEEASYQAKHMWARKHYGKPNKCEQKGSSYPKAVNKGRIMLDKPSRYEWANISGKYKRERSDSTWERKSYA